MNQRQKEETKIEQAAKNKVSWIKKKNHQLSFLFNIKHFEVWTAMVDPPIRLSKSNQNLPEICKCFQLGLSVSLSELLQNL